MDLNYGIIAFPSKKLQDLANTYRKRYDPHFALIRPHITLKDAFEADSVQFEEVKQKLETIASRFAPLSIHASRVSSFYPITNAIYFRIQPTDQLAAIHAAIQDELNIGADKHVFVPHITIAQKMTDTEHDDIFDQLRMIGVDEEEKIEEIHLAQQNEDNTWSITQSYKLTGAE
jgi:2'-5' RNA ligase